jgi:multiple sugar transport system substrate-binding protein
MVMDDRLNRRQVARMAGGSAALLGLGLPLRAFAQDTEESEEGVQETTEQEGKLNVTWWSHTAPAFVEGNLALIEAFEAANPDIHIVYQHFPYDVFVQKLQTGYNSGTVADMQQMFGSWVTRYAGFGLLDSMPDEMASGMADRFWPAAIGAYELDGKYFGQPKEYNLENGGMLVNPALLEEAGVTETPGTWADMVEAAKAATKQDGDLVTQAGLAFLNLDTVVFTYLSMILQQGETYFADDGTHVNLQSDAAKTAWNELASLVSENRVDSTQAFSTESHETFFQGKAAMCIRGPWVIAAGEGAYPDLEFRYDPVPPYAGDQMLFAAESGWGEVVNASAADDVKAAAWKFIDFMHQDDNLRQWNKTTLTVPSLQALKDDPELLEGAPGLKTSFAILEGGQWIGQLYDRDRFFQSLFDAITRVDLGEASPEDALIGAEQEINAMIDENLGP